MYMPIQFNADAFWCRYILMPNTFWHLISFGGGTKYGNSHTFWRQYQMNPRPNDSDTFWSNTFFIRIIDLASFTIVIEFSPIWG